MLQGAAVATAAGTAKRRVSVARLLSCNKAVRELFSRSRRAGLQGFSDAVLAAAHLLTHLQAVAAAAADAVHDAARDALLLAGGVVDLGQGVGAHADATAQRGAAGAHIVATPDGGVLVLALRRKKTRLAWAAGASRRCSARRTGVESSCSNHASRGAARAALRYPRRG